MEQAGLILPLPAPEEAELDEVDPIAAWYEWVGLPENHGQ
jgi:hypothetical protein